MPISATTTSPHSNRPGSNRCPGFLRKKVTVSAAATAPRTSPVSPIRPLGTSTATIGGPRWATAAKVAAAGPSSVRLKPGTKNRIHHQFRAIERGGQERLDGSRPPLRVMRVPRLPDGRAAEQGDANRPAGFGRAAGQRRSRPRRCCRARTERSRAAAASAARSRARRRRRHSPSDRWPACRRRPLDDRLRPSGEPEQRRPAIHHVSPPSPVPTGR